MSWVKDLFNNAGKPLPSKAKPYVVGILAFFGSLAWFAGRQTLTWGNWLDVAMVTISVTVLSIFFHSQIKKPSRDPRR